MDTENDDARQTGRNQQSDRRARRHTVADTTQYLRAVRLDLHASASPVSCLAAPELGGDRLKVYRQAGGHPFEDRNERLSMGFARGQKTQHGSTLPDGLQPS